jgi:mitochondrial enoyl-[acyl-carrier protein] reductase / trans-2-enoyl-CoA reductase
MRCVQFNRFGEPAEVVELVEVEPPVPTMGQALVDVLAAPINPADLLLVTGTHAYRPTLPARVGVEGVGVVATLGAGEHGVAMGDMVLLPPGGTWSEQVAVDSSTLIPLPTGMDPIQAAMLGVNPITALCLLTELRSLAPGDWLIQNAANSAVGRLVIRLAALRGIRTVNVVRRASLIPELAALGADVSLVDGEDLPTRVAAATEGAPLHLALDAIAGAAAGRLVHCLAPDSTLVVYGLLSGEPIQVPTARIVFEGITVIGFARLRALAAMGRTEVRARYAELAELVMKGDLTSEVAAVYPLEEVQTALHHVAQEGRDGKIVLSMRS